jgi:hypothetical protein
LFDPGNFQVRETFVHYQIITSFIAAFTLLLSPAGVLDHTPQPEAFE